MRIVIVEQPRSNGNARRTAHLAGCGMVRKSTSTVVEFTRESDMPNRICGKCLPRPKELRVPCKLCGRRDYGACAHTGVQVLRPARHRPGARTSDSSWYQAQIKYVWPDTLQGHRDLLALLEMPETGETRLKPGWEIDMRQASR